MEVDAGRAHRPGSVAIWRPGRGRCIVIEREKSGPTLLSDPDFLATLGAGTTLKGLLEREGIFLPDFCFGLGLGQELHAARRHG
jgi:hypothetical protein